jgi:hypothetical protein
MIAFCNTEVETFKIRVSLIFGDFLQQFNDSFEKKSLPTNLAYNLESALFI